MYPPRLVYGRRLESFLGVGARGGSDIYRSSSLLGGAPWHILVSFVFYAPCNTISVATGNRSSVGLVNLWAAS